METQERIRRIIYPWDRSIAEHNQVASEGMAWAAELRARQAATTETVPVIPRDIYDMTVSYAGRLEQMGDYLGASVLRTNIGLTVDNLDDGR